MNNAPSRSEMHGRIIAQRELLQWLLTRIVTDEALYQELVQDLDDKLIQSAVQASGHPVLAATGLEIRALLEPLAQRFQTTAQRPESEI